MIQLNSKVLLFGEYSILYNSMALVMPFERFSGELTFDTEGTESQNVTRSNEYLKKFCAFIAERMDESFVLEVKRFEKEIEKGLFFKSTIPVGSGLGSSGALVAAIFLRYLKKAKEIKDDVKVKWITGETPERLKVSLAQMESFFHGTSSGIDPLSIILNQPLLLKDKEHIDTVEIPEEKENGKNVIFLINTGVPRETSNLMGQFKTLCSQPAFLSKMEDNLVYYTNQSIETFLQNDEINFYQNLSKLTQFQLDEMSYFIPKDFHRIVSSGLDNGDYFLKMCGAGGGGFILGFTNKWEQTQSRLSSFSIEEIYRY